MAKLAICGRGANVCLVAIHDAIAAVEFAADDTEKSTWRAVVDRPPTRLSRSCMTNLDAELARGGVLHQQGRPAEAGQVCLATIPHAVPYLRADPGKVVAWQRRLAAFPGRRVGLVRAGSPRPGVPFANKVDQRRSMNLRQYAASASVPGLCLISLQKGDPAAQAREPPAGMVLHDWTDELDDLADTAALVEALDLVISVDTSMVHLAGALGKPLWVLNRFDQCWHWLRERSDSPWYPSARLFQQRAPGDWPGVMADVAVPLCAAMSGQERPAGLGADGPA